MKKNKNILLLILLICLLPVIFSWISYVFYGRLNLHTSNQGVLINPPLQISFINHENGAWQIVFIPDDCAGKATRHIMSNLESVRKLQGENQYRVGLTLLLKQACAMQTGAFHQVILTEQQLSGLKLTPGQIYLVDPQDNLFMSYTADADPIGIFKDLKRVLNVSQIG